MANPHAIWKLFRNPGVMRVKSQETACRGHTNTDMKCSDLAVLSRHRVDPFVTILGGGLAAGVLDGLDAAVVIPVIHKVSAIRVFQFIASGILGPSAFRGGVQTALLGCAIHFVIALSVASVYYVFALNIPVLHRKPILFGPLYGIAVFTLMHYVVVPLSAAPKQQPSEASSLVNLVLSHILLVGLPIAFAASRDSDRDALRARQV